VYPPDHVPRYATNSRRWLRLHLRGCQFSTPPLSDSHSLRASNPHLDRRLLDRTATSPVLHYEQWRPPVRLDHSGNQDFTMDLYVRLLAGREFCGSSNNKQTLSAAVPAIAGLLTVLAVLILAAISYANPRTRHAVRRQSFKMLLSVQVASILWTVSYM
jgi:hypothetical protein